MTRPDSPRRECVSGDFFDAIHERELLRRVVEAAEGIRPIRSRTTEESRSLHIALWSALDDLAIHLKGVVGPGEPRPILDGWTPPRTDSAPTEDYRRGYADGLRATAHLLETTK